jgi:hypothetical protein
LLAAVTELGKLCDLERAIQIGVIL